MTGPSKPLGMSDFFALEAGEYLERLDGLLAKGESPSADELVRLARALRGSALMANQPAIARAAAGLEALGRAVREGRRAWDAATRHLAVRGVDDLKVFVRRAASWTDADTAKAEGLAHELEQQAGRPSAQVRAVEALGLDAGARAFVAREGAAIASALDRAAQTLRGNPLAHDPLQHVLRALQPLRGLAAVNDLPPLPDLLEGLEPALANAGGGVLADRVAQFAIAAREAVASGLAVNNPAGFAAELRRVGDLLARPSAGDEEALAAELDGLIAGVRALQPGAPPPVVPIESLAPAPAPPPRPRARGAAEEAVPESADLVGSWAVYQRLVMGGVGPASLEELMAAAAQVPPSPRLRAPSLDTVRPAPGHAARPAGAELPAVDVRLLLYRGERALQRARELREAARLASGDDLRALVEEVCDLVALAVEPSPPS